MKVVFLVSLGALAAGILAQTGSTVFEKPNFNVTEALLDIGFNVSAISVLAGLAEQSLLTACSIACTSLNVIYSIAKVFIEVSALVLLPRLTGCPFTVKAGGHTAFAGSSSIEGGITVALESKNAITVSSDKKVASIGPGNVWLNAYQTLEQYRLAVMSTIGVPGLVLGGGISCFVNKFGWACANMASYEVVTASGIVITASITSHSDLYWALRGGGSNFGIIAKFNLNTFPQRSLWGDSRLYTPESFSQAVEASFGYLLPMGNVVTAQLQYGKPDPKSTIFNERRTLPALQDTTGVVILPQLNQNLGESAPEGTFRQTYWDVSFKLDRALMGFIVGKFFELVPGVLDVEGLLPPAAIQLITQRQLDGMKKNGGNSLGLDTSGGPRFIFNLAITWSKAEDEPRMINFCSDVIKAAKAEAQRLGADNDFIYMNYALQYQDPLGSYGAANLNKLRPVAAKYDPTAVFQKLLPGYFRLYGGAPNPNLP
ncbi:FAD-binding domain-containing protein [Lentithecium fluviatile CBS 122367]|uniref:FAD-binding domain-containing protein n=1 Tax=Lentithecium fluviatile CBS 122367 TaxID=1168545 RepID=A0A6G1J022_9PLEO|nr:FAD-binding domain-containing protein [Lentithecium fluviatile CBS 122367]